MTVVMKCNRCGFTMKPAFNITTIHTYFKKDDTQYEETYHLCEQCTKELIKWLEVTVND
jgi:hypothetical protein